MWERIINSVLPKIGWRQGEKAGHLGRDELWVKGRRVFRRKAEIDIDVEGKRSPNVRNIWKGNPRPSQTPDSTLFSLWYKQGPRFPGLPGATAC